MDWEQTFYSSAEQLACWDIAHTHYHVFKCRAGSLVWLSPFLDCQLLEGSDLGIFVHLVLSIMLVSNKCLINIVILMNQRQNISTFASCSQRSSRPCTILLRNLPMLSASAWGLFSQIQAELTPSLALNLCSMSLFLWSFLQLLYLK